MIVSSEPPIVQQIVKGLTKKQRARYQQMLGEPFDLATMRSSGPSKQPVVKTGDKSQKPPEPE